MNTEPVVIYTGCDANYARHIPTLMMSIKKYMAAYDVRFFFLHTDCVPSDMIQNLHRFGDSIRLHFEDITVAKELAEKYGIIRRKLQMKSFYPIEGFFDMLPNLHLPPDTERALYVNAGDVIFSGDISEFYFSDFKGNAVTVSKGFASGWAYTADDLYDKGIYPQLAAEYFNAGVILFNVALMRKLDINFDYYISIINLLEELHGSYYLPLGKENVIVFQDQGLLGAAMAGFVNFYDPDNNGNINTTYNFRPYVLECNKNNITNAKQLTLENLKPKIIHLLGNKPGMPAGKRKTLLRISQQCLQLWDQFEQEAHKIMETLP